MLWCVIYGPKCLLLLSELFYMLWCVIYGPPCTVFSQNTFYLFIFLETTMSTRLHSLTICGQGSVISILQLPASASGYTRTPRVDLIPRVDMVVSTKKKKKVSTLLPEEKCACTICQRLFSSRRVQLNPGFSLVQVNLPLNLFENRITRTPSSSENKVSLYSFGVQNKLISFSLFLMIRFSNKSVFEQPSRAN